MSCLTGTLSTRMNEIYTNGELPVQLFMTATGKGMHQIDVGENSHEMCIRGSRKHTWPKQCDFSSLQRQIALAARCAVPELRGCCIIDHEDCICRAEPKLAVGGRFPCQGCRNARHCHPHPEATRLGSWLYTCIRRLPARAWCSPEGKT